MATEPRLAVTVQQPGVRDGDRALMASPVVDLNDAVNGRLVSSVLGVGDAVGTIGSCDTVEAHVLQ